MAIPDLNETRTQNEILATTLPNIGRNIVNNAINHHAGVSIFFGKLAEEMFGPQAMEGKAARPKTGESIEVRVQLDKSSNSKALESGYSEFSKDVQDTTRVLRANWKLYGGTVIISGQDRRNNRGMERIADLLEHRVKTEVNSLVDLVAQDLYNGDGVSELTGLDSIISANDSIQNASGASYSHWNSRGVSAKGTAAGSISFSGGSFASQGVDDWIKAWMGSSEGMKQPEFLLTTEDVYRYYEGSLAPEIRYSKLAVGDGSFRNLQFRGKPIFHDSYATSGVTYFVNTEHLYAAYSPGALFDVTPMQDQSFQDVFTAKVLFQGNFVTDGRKFVNKVTGQTA